jgi:hypothetical protein
MEEGLGIHIGTRDERLQPAGARAAAVKVDGDGTHLVVYVWPAKLRAADVYRVLAIEPGGGGTRSACCVQSTSPNREASRVEGQPGEPVVAPAPAAGTEVP